VYHIQKGSSSHGGGTAQHHLPVTQAAVDAAGGDGKTSNQMNVEEEFQSTDVQSVQRDGTTLTFSNDVIRGTRPVTSHGSASAGQCSTSCVQRHVNNDARLMLQPPPSTFLAPPPYPFHLCPPPYPTSFPPPLYSVRPRPLTQFRVTPFDGCVEFQPSGSGSSSNSDAGFDARRHLLGGLDTSLWRPGVIDGHLARWSSRQFAGR